jgi:hypothetical protein
MKYHLSIGYMFGYDRRDLLAHTSMTIMDDRIRIDVLRGHFVHTATFSGVFQMGKVRGTTEVYLPYEVSAST